MLDNKATGDNNTFWTKVTDAFMDLDYTWNVSADTSFSGDEYSDDSDSAEADDVSDEMLLARVAKQAQKIRECRIANSQFPAPPSVEAWKKDWNI
ncbi:hypothetical protein SARC_06224 [Sphaeroforma arctica JP610]|uniref:Uncharacterized protein n=1 Tax=Sphaeroforma arctica JP610 TaxID=667725 RepID=A0A0L0FX86_9EUKA|nr:hypothetical protein SARC_06224 [Sphaeroforma arctica JP610]KNC81455.1 hypothetical protein SARC_06224 [Sphaeroforma arctica JP610]|eukprot:XP_014155357.1 hypothetical protein SARC_06224 [Sphaeroforma arctica JP610]